MSAVAHHAINSLYRRFVYDSKRFRANEQKMQRLSDAYFQYRDLLHEQERVCDQIIKIFGVLGVHSPDVSKDLAKAVVSGVSQDLATVLYSDVSQQERITIHSSDVRKNLKLWQVLELFLSSVDNKATASDFRDFLFELDVTDKPTPQAIESAVKTHPDLFGEEIENGQKFLVLKRGSEDKRSF
jgi:hypothetical protein